MERDWNAPDAVPKAAALAAGLREQCLENGRSLAFETVLSMPDKVEFIRRAREAGFFVRLFFVGTDDPSINAKRVALRVMEGGHDVPISKIIARYTRSLANCSVASRLADRAYIYDNSIEDVPARLLFRTAEGRLIRNYGSINPWAREILREIDPESTVKEYKLHGNHQSRTRRQGAGAAQDRAWAFRRARNQECYQDRIITAGAAGFIDDPLLGERPITEWDVAALLKLMWEAWNDVFRKTLGPAERSLVSELRDHRNKWAHQETFSSDDAYRALDSAARLLTAVSAPQADEIEKMKMELLRAALRRAGAQREAQERRHGDRERRQRAASSPGARW